MNDPILGFEGEYRWLSNFYPLDTPILYEDLSFPTVEHAYQAMKCAHFADMKYISEISAGQAKRAGRKVEQIPGFDDNKLMIVEHFLTLKFSIPKFKKLLLATGDRYIEETNTWGDTFWGVCNGKGENNLGKIIMKIRDTLK